MNRVMVVSVLWLSACLQPVEREPESDPPAPGICGQSRPSVTNFQLSNASAVEGEAAIEVVYDASDSDGDLSRNFALVYDDLVDGQINLNISGSFEVNSNIPPEEDCSLSSLSMRIGLLYSDILAFHFPPNTRIEAQLLVSDLVDIENAEFTPEHTGASAVVEFCTPKENGDNSDASGCP